MKVDDVYLRAVLAPAPATRLIELFQRRRERFRSDERPQSEAAAPLSPAQVEATLRRIEAQLLTVTARENEREIIALIGQTDNHTPWWRRLKIVNESRAILSDIGKHSAHWSAIIARLQPIVAAPDTEREEARNRFLHEVAPILSRPQNRISEIYQLTQTYGDKHVFEALMTRLLVDAPELYQLERPFFEKFNPNAAGGLATFRQNSPVARAKYCPLPEAPPVPFPRRRAIAAAAVLGAAILTIVIRSSRP